MHRSRPRRELDAAGIEPEYLEARDAESLAPTRSFNGRPVLVAVAARLGPARLIDNVVIGDPAPSAPELQTMEVGNEYPFSTDPERARSARR